MERVTKLHGHSVGRNGTPIYDLPQGEYRVCAPDGEVITISVRTEGSEATAVTLRVGVGVPPLSVGLDGWKLAPMPRVEAHRVEIAHYYQNAHAQAFKRWYDHQETAEDVALLGESYKR